MAVMLRNKGITKVRPLAGGIAAWRERNFPVKPVKLAESAGAT
jgi:rhodanese-related sulfurtransferase